MGTVLGYLRPHGVRVAFGVTVKFTAALLELVLPLLLEHIVDVSVPARDLTAIWFCGGIMAALAFVAVNPFSYKPDYAPELASLELERLGVSNSRELCYYALCVVREPVGESTVNLRCPVALNDRTREAVQVILETEQYLMHHPLTEFERGGEAQVC